MVLLHHQTLHKKNVDKLWRAWRLDLKMCGQQCHTQIYFCYVSLLHLYVCIDQVVYIGVLRLYLYALHLEHTFVLTFDLFNTSKFISNSLCWLFDWFLFDHGYEFLVWLTDFSSIGLLTYGIGAVGILMSNLFLYCFESFDS